MEWLTISYTCAQEPVRLEVGSHITIKDGFSADAPDKIIYVPFLKNLESILQNDDIQAQVAMHHNLILFDYNDDSW